MLDKFVSSNEQSAVVAREPKPSSNDARSVINKIALIKTTYTSYKYPRDIDFISRIALTKKRNLINFKNPPRNPGQRALIESP